MYLRMCFVMKCLWIVCSKESVGNSWPEGGNEVRSSGNKHDKHVEKLTKMRNLPVLVFSISLLSVILATEVETKAEAGTTDYYLLLTLNGSERTVSRVEVDKYGRYIYKGRKIIRESKLTL